MTHPIAGDTPALHASRGKLAQDIALISEEAGALIAQVGGRSLQRAQRGVDEVGTALRHGASEAVGFSRSYLRAHPVQTLGVTAVVALAIGLAFARA